MSIVNQKNDGPLSAALKLLPVHMDSIDARVLVLSTGYHETKLIAQRQVNGPAVGLFQFEKAGGVHGVLTHPASKDLAAAICEYVGVEPTDDAVHAALAKDGDAMDVLDCALARLLYFTDPRKMPVALDGATMLQMYLRVWRPGIPHADKWGAEHRLVIEALGLVHADIEEETRG